MFNVIKAPGLISLRLLCGLIFLGIAPACALAATTYYVDCSASSNGDGSQSNPWNSLTNPNATTFEPGDELLFLRGTTCSGKLTPLGSGNAGAPVTIDAYGTGDLPILDGGTANAETIYLHNVQYYDVQDISVVGSNSTAIYAYADIAGERLTSIHLSNLTVSAVNKIAKTRSDGGGIIFYSGKPTAYFADVLIDGVTVDNLTAAEGINIGSYYSATSPVYNAGVVVQNSTVHDVYGDGILVWGSANVVVQNNVVYHSGLCSACTGSTPVGLWTWYTSGATAQNNESYSNQTWSAANTDGGDYDIDYWNLNNIYQYNYGHDSQGYCFLAEGYTVGAVTTTNSNIIRYNICANDVQKDTSNGEVFLYAYGKGRLDGLQIYNNTIYVNGVPGTYALLDEGAYSGMIPNFFKNNLIYSTAPEMINATSKMKLNNNLYWNSAGTGYTFTYANTTYSDFADYQTGSGQDALGLNLDPLLNGAGYHDTPLPSLANGDYTLQPGSPALNAGANVCLPKKACITGSAGTQDFYGQPLTKTHNIGAYDAPTGMDLR
jgi:hypothetical protein